MRFLLPIIFAFAFTGIADAQEPAKQTVPEACRAQPEGMVDYKACFDSSEPKSAPWLWAAINLGTQAFVQDDFEGAAHYYDLSEPDNSSTMSDIVLHAHRSYVFRRLGRLDDALNDARIAMNMIEANRFDLRGHPLNEPTKLYVLTHIVQSYYESGDEDYPKVLRSFLSMPAVDEIDLANKAAVLTEIGEYEAAVVLSEELVDAMPNSAGVQNNHCYLLSLTKRPADALAFCERAVELAPENAATQHSFASVLASLGRCREADVALQAAHTLEPSAVLYEQKLSCAPTKH